MTRLNRIAWSNVPGGYAALPAVGRPLHEYPEGADAYFIQDKFERGLALTAEEKSIFER